MNRRRFLMVAGGTAVAAAVPGALVIGSRGDDNRAAAADDQSGDSGRSTATVARRDLAETKSVSGTFGYGESRELAIGKQGTITALPAVGTVVDRGGQLAEVDGLPVFLFLGDRPMWRPMQEGTTDGLDVEQLEANLIELGYGTGGNLGPNQLWSEATTAAVKRWQVAVGLEETGAIGQGDVTFQPTAVRLAEHVGKVGGPAGGPLFKVTGTTKVVDVDLDANYQSLVAAGQQVQIELPDGTTTTGTITYVGTVATASQQGQGSTVPMTLTLDDQSVGGNLDRAPVSVSIATSKASDVLAVPVGALLALAEGGFAVEKVTGPDTTQLVAVQTGAFAGGWVEVSGGVTEGDEVIVPR